MSFQHIKKKSSEFDELLTELKTNNPMNWYPYGTLSGFYHLDHLFKDKYDDFFSELNGKQIADIGTADGDMAFFFESLGFDVDMIDCKQPNFNKLEGANKLKQLLSSNNNIYDIDLDSQFSLPKQNYDLIIFMGILYHLKNPFYILEKLAHASKYLILSTRIAKHTPDRKNDMKNYPLAYLVDASETFNNDSTNYWMFSETGLKRILDRTYWDIINYITVGDIINSDPVSQNNDERAFVLLKSKAI